MTCLVGMVLLWFRWKLKRWSKSVGFKQVQEWRALDSTGEVFIVSFKSLSLLISCLHFWGELLSAKIFSFNCRSISFLFLTIFASGILELCYFGAYTCRLFLLKKIDLVIIMKCPSSSLFCLELYFVWYLTYMAIPAFLWLVFV